MGGPVNIRMAMVAVLWAFIACDGRGQEHALEGAEMRRPASSATAMLTDRQKQKDLESMIRVANDYFEESPMPEGVLALEEFKRIYDAPEP